MTHKLARAAVGHASSRGKLPKVKSLLCMDCGNPAQEYDHPRGYDENHVLDVEPVCRKCHTERTVTRGERPRGVDHGLAKLNDAAVVAIRRSSESLRVLAQRFGVDRSTISDVRKRVTWTHVPEVDDG